MFIGNYFKNINIKFKNHLFSGLSFNSSYCKKNYIFFAIKGNNLDGNKFIDRAIKKGRGNDSINYEEVTFEGYALNGIAS